MKTIPQYFFMTTKNDTLLRVSKELRRYGPCLSCEIREVFFQLADDLDEKIKTNNFLDTIWKIK